MAKTMDVIVLGLGGMGSAAACQLALRGHRVVGFEQFTTPHNKGASHGATRVIRQSYFESPAYVPLLLRAYELWRDLERATERDLLNTCGGLMTGRPDSEVVAGSRRSAETHGLPHEMLDAREINRRYPAFQLPAGAVGLFEANAGFLHTEASVKAHLDRAAELGAELHFETPALGWSATANGVEVRTASGRYQAEKLVITAGAWTSKVLADLGLPLEVERQVLYWLQPTGGVEPFRLGHFPIFIHQASAGLLPYGFPSLDGPEGGVKVALYRAPIASICTPDTVDREIHPAEIEIMRNTIAEIIPSLRGTYLKGATCLYTNTPDKHFILDTHPAHPRVCIGGGFSGHGFKFCSVVGEVLAELAESGKSRLDLSPFRLGRLRTGGP